MAKRMAEQMELFKPVERGFEEGGLMDEGGMVDEMSGNEVPPGSLREEVRDDIPAQLSEGEFVFPADVVRYFGLEKLMKMRQEAKMGLKRMEEMGQMGNSEEAIMPDDLPFTLDDLDMKDEEEYNNTQEFARGGVVYAQEGTFVNPDPQSGIYYQPPSPITTGIAQDPVVAASAPAAPMGGYTPPQQAFTPVRPPRELTPAFQGVVGFGPEGVEYETVTYVNEAGQTLVLKKNKQTGQLLDLAGNPATVPEGYKLKGEEEEEVVAPVTTQTTQVTEQGDGGRDDETESSGASIALGGKAVGPAIGGGIPGTRYAGASRKVVGSTLYDVSFKNVGMNPVAFSLNMLSKDGGLPPEGSGVIGVKGNKKATIELPAVAYNSLRNNPRGPQAKAVQEALAARDALTRGNKTSYVDGVLSVEDKNGDMVAVSKDAIDLIGSTMYSEIKAEADGTFGFGKTDNLVDTARDYFSGMSDREEKNARDALSAYNDQQFSDFVSQDEVYGGGSSQDDNNNNGPQGDEASGGSVSGDMSDDSDG